VSKATLLRLLALPGAVLSFAVAGCFPLSPPAPAGATATGGSAALAGLDPYDTRCAAGAVTAARAEARDASGTLVAFVELRRSPRCGTTWARAVRIAPARGILAATIRGQGYTSAFEHPTDGEVWTDMIPSDRGCATATGGVRATDGGRHDATVSWCDAGPAVRVASR
jgi:hypothetical protein